MQDLLNVDAYKALFCEILVRRQLRHEQLPGLKNSRLTRKKYFVSGLLFVILIAFLAHAHSKKGNLELKLRVGINFYVTFELLESNVYRISRKRVHF